MWIVVYMAQNKQQVLKLRDVLEKAGMLVKIRPAVNEPDSEDNCYELLVPETEAAEAHSIIIDTGF